MTDDVRDEDLEDMESEALHDDGGDPTAAFEALREAVEELSSGLLWQMTTLRKGVEMALDQFDKVGTPVDYSAELGRMTQQLATVGERLQAVERSPILGQGAEYYARVLERSGDGLVRSAVLGLERQASDLERVSNVLASHNKSALHRKDQDFRMWIAAGIGLIAGAFLLAVLPRFLPFSADSHVAALVMGGDRIDAAYAMIGSVDPLAVKRMQWGAQFYSIGPKIGIDFRKARCVDSKS